MLFLNFDRCCDEGCPIKEKMVYASTKDTVKKSFPGITFERQAAELEELDYNEYVKEISKK
jgi:hypothetical protein